MNEQQTSKNNPQVVGVLNKVLANELVSINQYFLHSRMLGNWGLKALESAEYKASLDEMKHADALIKRLLMLDGTPEMNLGPMKIGADVEEILKNDLALEYHAVPTIKEGIEKCEKNNDYVSRRILTGILESEEEHIDWLETQLNLCRQMGMELFLQTAVRED